MADLKDDKTEDKTEDKKAEKTYTQTEFDAELAGLKTAIARERENAAEAAEFKGLGMKPKEIKKMLDDRAAAEQKKLEEEGDFKKILEQHQEKWALEKAELVARAENSENGTRTYVGESALISEMAKQGATEEGLDLLPTRYLKRLGVEMNGGKPSLNILNRDGVTPMAGNSDDGTATLADLVAEAVKAYPSLFKSEAKGGGGKPPGTNGAGSSTKTVTRQVFDGWTQPERAAHFKSGGSVVNA